MINHQTFRAPARGAMLAILVLVLGFSTSCAISEKRENLKNCEFKLANFDVVNYGLTALDLRLDLDVKNPNASEVVLDRLEFKVVTKDREIATGKHEKQVTIPSGQTGLVQLDLSSSPAKLGVSVLDALLSGGDLPYKIEGVAYLDTPLGPLVYPIKLEGNLKDVADDKK